MLTGVGTRELGVVTAGPEQSLGAEDVCIPSLSRSCPQGRLFPAHNQSQAHLGPVLGPCSAPGDCSDDSFLSVNTFVTTTLVSVLFVLLFVGEFLLK